MTGREYSSHPHGWERTGTIDLNFGWQWDGRWLAVLQREELLVVDTEHNLKTRIALPRYATWGVHFGMSGSNIIIGWPSDDGYGATLQLIENPLDPKLALGISR